MNFYLKKKFKIIWFNNLRILIVKIMNTLFISLKILKTGRINSFQISIKIK
jgi:hypothetical protein